VNLDPDALAVRRARRRRRSSAWRWVAIGLAFVAIFAVGIALGEALHDNPTPGGTRTTQRTLRPLPLVPQTVTVTVPRR
jgi:anti-sigma-K factor RskA